MASSSALTLDHLATPSADSPAVLDDHLFYPNIDESPAASQPSESRPLLKDRLYIGNLHPSVDEYTLLHVFSKFGKITKLDWLFHKAGALKGKPRGYAFVEYATADDAMKAMTNAHGKLLRGRKLVVTFAHQAPLDQHGTLMGPTGIRGRKAVMDVGRPTALSMLKTSVLGPRGHEGKTKDKIAVLEAKLRQMEQSAPTPGVASSSPSMTISPAASTPSPAPVTPPSTGVNDSAHMSDTQVPPLSTTHNKSVPLPPPSTLPLHPSLPAKPPPQIPGAPAPVAPPWLAAQQLQAKQIIPGVMKPAAASKPVVNLSSLAKPSTSTMFSGSSLMGGLGTTGSGGSAGGGLRTKKLVGVKIKKDKAAEKGKDKDGGTEKKQEG